jgi:hypothetical protein
MKTFVRRNFDRNSMRREIARNTYRVRASKMPDEAIAINPNVKAATSKRVMKGWSSWLTEMLRAIAWPEWSLERSAV